MPEDWKAAWDPVIAAIGQPYRGMDMPAGALPDAVERGAIRKYLEPLELDCGLHYDPEVARAHGHPDVVAPYTATTAFALLPMWQPGTTLFTSDDRDAQPEMTSVKPKLPEYFPPITGYFATDMDYEFLRPATVGDVVRMEPGPLLSCEPKETSVGRGAFIKSETRLVNQHGELLAVMRSTTFLYNPHPKDEA
jgi:hypothetical protein